MTRIRNHQNPQRKTHILYYTKNILHIMNQRPQLFAKREALYVRCYIEERTVELANYIIKNKCTVREAARKFGISKSTVHKDLSERRKILAYVLTPPKTQTPPKATNTSPTITTENKRMSGAGGLRS